MQKLHPHRPQPVAAPWPPPAFITQDRIICQSLLADAKWFEQPKVVALGGSAVPEVVASQVSVRYPKTHLKPIDLITSVEKATPVSTSPLQAAMDAGLIRWNGQKPVLPPPVALRGEGTLLSDIVIEDLMSDDNLVEGRINLIDTGQSGLSW